MEHKANTHFSCVDCMSKSCLKLNGKNPPFCLTTALSEDARDEMRRQYTLDKTVQKVRSRLLKQMVSFTASIQG